MVSGYRLWAPGRAHCLCDVQKHALGRRWCFFLNPCTGDVFVASHKQSPLIDIGCILTAENIFANIQGDTSPHLLSYNVKDSSIWRPFFQDPSAQRDDWCIGCSCVCNPGPSRISRPATLASIQDLHLRYDAPNIVHAEQIQVKLTEEIKGKANNMSICI